MSGEDQAPGELEPDEDEAAGVAPKARADESNTSVLPIRMLHDRILVDTDDESGERRST
ncbi:MAG: hypothetical protein GX875_00865, partial [Propionibacterium sp.]|nr:hypothetical protein [Propionibacterium sp.]